MGKGVISFRATKEDKERFDRLCASAGLNRTEGINELIKMAVNGEKIPQGNPFEKKAAQ